MQIPKISIRIHPDDLDQLRKLADDRGERISDLIRQAIIDFLRKNAK